MSSKDVEMILDLSIIPKKVLEEVEQSYFEQSFTVLFKNIKEKLNNFNFFCFNIATLLREFIKIFNQHNLFSKPGIVHSLTLYGLFTSYLKFIKEVLGTDLVLLPFTKTLIFYLSPYDFIKAPYKRNSQYVRFAENLYKVLAQNINRFKAEFYSLTYHDITSSTNRINKNIDILFILLPPTIPTFSYFKSLFKSVFTNTINKNVLFVTNYYIDIFAETKDTRIFLGEMYTGNILDRFGISKKLFNLDIIPFHIYSYLLLGDKYLYKGLFNSEQKKDFNKRIKLFYGYISLNEYFNWLEKNNYLEKVKTMYEQLWKEVKQEELDKIKQELKTLKESYK